MHEFLHSHAALWQDSAFEARHIEEQIRVVLAVDRHERAFPFNRRHRARQPILDVPEDGSSQIHIVLHQSHSSITRPALLVVVANDVLIVRIGMLGEVALNEVSRFFRVEAEEDPDSIDVSTIQTNRMRCLCGRVLKHCF